MWFDSRALKGKVQEYTAHARDAADPEEKERLLSMARSYLLLAKNAAWIASTDDFLDAMKKGRRWPHPKDLDVVVAQQALASLGRTHADTMVGQKTS